MTDMRCSKHAMTTNQENVVCVPCLRDEVTLLREVAAENESAMDEMNICSEADGARIMELHNDNKSLHATIAALEKVAEAARDACVRYSYLNKENVTASNEGHFYVYYAPIETLRAALRAYEEG